MRVARRLVQEQVLHDDALHGGHRRDDVPRVRIRLYEVLALHVEAAKTAVERGLEHVRDPQAGLVRQRDLPCVLEQAAHRVIRHVTVAAELVRE